MRRFLALCAGLAVGPAAASTDAIALPSGLTATFLDVITDAPGLGLAYRFRFVSPDLTQDRDYASTEADMVHLCRSYALPRIETAKPRPGTIVITLADRPVPFGASDPEAVQFFEAYVPEGQDCVWAEF